MSPPSPVYKSANSMHRPSRAGNGRVGTGIIYNLAGYPFAGRRMLRDLLRPRGFDVGRLPVGWLMKKMGIEAIYPRPNTSKPAPGHRIYPYLLRGLAVTRPNQVWAMDIR